jgi:hypothetical protein
MKNTKEPLKAAAPPQPEKIEQAPPKGSSRINRLKGAKDIPVSTKGPRRQKSSRFQVNEERPELEKLPAFKGMYWIALYILIYWDIGLDLLELDI